ncbi:glycosyltransferase [Cohnella luojiensis]|uniref:Glycosyltransferase family 4 protein n=1 Tax=Cohnella luojiensis TaxID=652876 RepID=A0A4Y8LYS5_9BACL|nr:glycosyltransferase [Cohnella luojiensis]TFE27274.1 glycosyltransferase family 4 protein [Cohnella luojiensis]
MNGNLRVAIVHDYLNQMGGAERVVSVLHRMFPQAPIYTTVADRNKLLPELKDADIRTTWMQKIPGILKRYKHFFWLYPFAVRFLNLQGYDLVISSSSAYSKGVVVKGKTVHICYCHTPMRFAWDFSTYMEGSEISAIQKWLAKWAMLPLRIWDKTTSLKIHHMIANSTVVQHRIESCYGRKAEVIFPPVDVSRFQISDADPGDYFLVVSRLVSYKRIDLAVEACTKIGKPLIIIGEGPDRKRLESLAGPTVTFMGRLPDDQVAYYMQHCRGFLFPGIEDFGITPLEANASGRPVVAFKGGGALDTIVPGVNGIFFDLQTADSLATALMDMDQTSWDPLTIRNHAEQFSVSIFIRTLFQYIDNNRKEFNNL